MPRPLASSRWIITAAFAGVLLVGWMAVQFASSRLMDLRVKFAREQIEIFDDMVSRSYAATDNEEVEGIKS